MKKIIFIIGLAIFGLFAFNPTTIYALDSEVVEETIEEPTFIEQASEFFTGGEWSSLVATLSSGGLLGTLLALLKKTKKWQNVTTYIGEVKEKLGSVENKYSEITKYVAEIPNQITAVSEKADNLIAMLGVAVAGMNVKEEYKVEMLKMVEDLKAINKTTSTVATGSVTLATKIIEDKKDESTKEIVELKDDITQAVNKLLD